MTPILETKGFAAAVLDALVSQICVLDRNGVIITVNRAWTTFKTENSVGPQCSDLGVHYLDVCRAAIGDSSDEGEPFGVGVWSVLSGRSNLFQLEYLCHSPTQQRWFLGRVTPLDTPLGGAVVSHMDITDRKLVELELAGLAVTDPLTGLPNRRFFEKEATLELDRIRQFGSAASVIMLDLDHFKAVNDTYGHAVGDEALRSLTRLCRALLRQGDVLARQGGEEFVILLPETKEGAAMHAAEKLRSAIEGITLRHGRDVIALTASFGVTELRAADQTIMAALARADTALYAAKSFGRNCVMGFSEIAGRSTGLVA